MTEKEKAKKLLPIIQAIAEGKKIQYSFNRGIWFDKDENLNLVTVCEDIISDSTDYRIKSEENYTIEQNCGENRIEGGKMIRFLYAISLIALFPIIVIVLGVYMWATCFIDFMKE